MHGVQLVLNVTELASTSDQPDGASVEPTGTFVPAATTMLPPPPPSAAAAAAAASKLIFYDCYSGIELTPIPVDASSNDHGGAVVSLSFEMEALGYGCVFATPAQVQTPANSNLMEFLDEMQAMARKGPLSSFSSKWNYLLQEMVPNPPSTVKAAIQQPAPPLNARLPPRSSSLPATPAQATSRPAPVLAPIPPAPTPKGMVLIPRTVNYRFETSGVEIESGPNDHGSPDRYANNFIKKPLPHRYC